MESSNGERTLKSPIPQRLQACPEVSCLRRANVIGSKWAFKLKPDNKRNARIVAKGWNQVHGREYYETYAPVCRLQSIRMVLAITAYKNWEVIQVDVNTAFLYASFEEEEKVLVEMAPRFVQFTKDGVRYVLDLQKSLYGLDQSPRNWWKTIDPKLIEIGFVPLNGQLRVHLPAQRHHSHHHAVR